MRTPLSRKIILLFLPMTTISLVLGTLVYSGLSGIRLANHQISMLKDFQLQIKELEILQASMPLLDHHDYPEKFNSALVKTRETMHELIRLHWNLPHDLKLRLESLPDFTLYH